MKINVLAAALVLLSAPASLAAPADTKAALAGIDALIIEALEEHRTPGAAVAVVVDGEVVLLEGYGYRDVDRKLHMTADTLVPLASVTKQFTVAALGTFARQGRMDWDAPVRDYMADFRLADDYATLRATPRDLVTHRIGLPRHDWAWFGSESSRAELYGRLRHFPFNKDVRTTFQYNNFMYMTAGHLVERLAGKPYEEYVASALFEPVGMTRTTFSLDEIARDPDHAMGYELDNDLRPVPEAFVSADAMAPGGAINSSARDLARWMQMLLAGGQIGDRRILQASDVQAMMQPAMPVGPSMFPEFGYRSYGMGFFVQNYRGYEVASHGGNMPGAATNMVLIPSRKIGIVVLTNRSYGRVRDGLPYEIIDRLLGLEPANLLARHAQIEARVREGESAARSAGVSDRKPGTTPSHDLADYVGHYHDPGYGRLEVALVDGKLAMTYNGYSAALHHWHYDVFQTPEDRTSELDRVRVQFHGNLEGEIAAMSVPMEPSVEETRFVKLPPAELTDPEFLRRFVGAYDVGGVKREILLREDGVLQYVVFGQSYELVPVRGTLFRMKEFSGVSIEFLSDAAGNVDRMAIHEGGSTMGPKTK